jgi:hypothetical protein
VELPYLQSCHHDTEGVYMALYLANSVILFRFIATHTLPTGANTSLCRISNPLMARDSWHVAYGDNALSFSSDPDSVLTMTMTGTTAARLETKVSQQ